MSEQIKYGDRIWLQHSASYKFLASLPRPYIHPRTSGQQMVVGRDKPDDGAIWIVRGPHTDGPEYGIGTPVGRGAVIRLTHEQTSRNLHSHPDRPSPLTGQQEVTAYGNDGKGNDDDNWQLQFESKTAAFWTKDQQFTLLHCKTGVVLHSHGGHSNPALTNGEQEITCIARNDFNDIWLIPSEAPKQTKPSSNASEKRSRLLEIANLIGSIASITGWSLLTLGQLIPHNTLIDILSVVISILLVGGFSVVVLSLAFHKLQGYRNSPLPRGTRAGVYMIFIGAILLFAASIYWLIPHSAGRWIAPLLHRLLRI